MNNCKIHKGKIKFGGYKGGRGYSGYHTTHFGKKVYLRSLQEFIYARYLDSLGVYYLTENITYDINGHKYKPDFFVYEGAFDLLTKIVEIKYTNKEVNDYRKYFQEYFNKHGIEYQVLGKYDIKQIVKNKIVPELELFYWKNQFVKSYKNFDYTGEKNPMYRVKHSDETKRKIGNQTRKYFKNPVIRLRHKIGRKRYWNTDDGKKMKRKYADFCKKRFTKNIPTIILVCKECGNEYQHKENERYHKETCSNSCQQKYNWRIGKNKYGGGAKKTYKTKMINYYKIITSNGIKPTEENYDKLVLLEKNKGNVTKHFGMNLEVVKKYFGSLDNLQKEVR